MELDIRLIKCAFITFIVCSFLNGIAFLLADFLIFGYIGMTEFVSNYWLLTLYISLFSAGLVVMIAHIIFYTITNFKQYNIISVIKVAESIAFVTIFILNLIMAYALSGVY